MKPYLKFPSPEEWEEERKMNLVKEEVSLLNPNALVADGLDSAIVGYGQQFPKEPVLVYDYDKCVQVFMGQGMSEDEAIEWMEYNVVNAYVGEGTPIFMKLAVNLCACPAAAPYGEQK